MIFLRAIAISLAWMLIIWGALGLTANGTDLYTSDSNNKTDIFKVMAFHLFLVIAGLFVRKKLSQRNSEKAE